MEHLKFDDTNREKPRKISVTPFYPEYGRIFSGLSDTLDRKLVLNEDEKKKREAEYLTQPKPKLVEMSHVQTSDLTYISKKKKKKKKKTKLVTLATSRTPNYQGTSVSLAKNYPGKSFFGVCNSGTN